MRVSRPKLRNQLGRCRSSFGAGDRMCARMPGSQREPRPLPEAIEVSFDPRISDRQRAYVLGHDGLFYEICGTAPGDIDDLTGYRATFHIELISDNNCGGKDELSNLRTLCSTCNQGAKNITAEKPSAIWLLSQVRRAGQEEQRAVLNWLLKKFKK